MRSRQALLHAACEGDEGRLDEEPPRAGELEASNSPARVANPRTPIEVLDLAGRLRRERPQRIAAYIYELLGTVNSWALDEL
ncbi:MAG: hypothetical protein M0020_09990 [Actinomycetota bacterium]|nr:hypothetical protein [Actinomycetota bacterium]